MTLVLMNAHFPIVNLRSRRGVVGIAALVGLLLGLVELGNQRLNRFGRYSVSYGDAIGFRAYRGPGEAVAVAYGYFALSFENLDRFVKENPEYRTGGLLSFSPLFNALFFVNRLTAGKYPGPDAIVDRRNPVGPMATVETALAPFYLDFGAGMAWVPMLFYMLVWLWLYSRRHRSAAYVTAYAGYSASMVLSAFQGVVAAPFIYQSLALALLPLALYRPTFARERSVMIVPVTTWTRVRGVISRPDLPTYVALRASGRVKSVLAQLCKESSNVVLWAEYTQMAQYLRSVTGSVRRTVLVCQDVLGQLCERY